MGEAIAPIHWTTTMPEYRCKPRSALVDPWRGDSTPELGVAWYGLFNGDPTVKAGQIREVIDEVGPMIAGAVEKVIAKAAAQMGTPRPPRTARPVRVNVIVETANAPTTAPPGYLQMMASEIFALAGVDFGDLPDAVAYVQQRPTTREQAQALLINMSMTVPR